MNLSTFLKKLLPSLERTEVVDDLKNSIRDLDKIRPALADAAHHFTVSPMKSSENDYLEKEFYKNWTAPRGQKTGTFLGDLAEGAANAADNAKYILACLETDTESYYLAEAMTAKKAAVLRASGAISFISRYLGSLLGVIYANEAIEANADMKKTIDVKAPVRFYVNRNITTLGYAYTDYAVPKQKFEKTIGAIADVFVGGSNMPLAADLYKATELDPMVSSALISNAFENPIFSIRMVFAQWQIARHNSVKYKAEQLKLRLLHLQELQSGKQSPAMEKEITRLQDRIDKIDKEIFETEQSVGVE